jgi:hypothetical protein
VEMVSGARQSVDDLLGGGRPLRIADDVLSRRIVDETLILRLEDEMYFSLEGVGSQIWGLLGQGASLDHIVEVLADRYEVDPSRLEADVRAVLANLLQSGLIELDEESIPPT